MSELGANPYVEYRDPWEGGETDDMLQRIQNRAAALIHQRRIFDLSFWTQEAQMSPRNAYEARRLVSLHPFSPPPTFLKRKTIFPKKAEEHVKVIHHIHDEGRQSSLLATSFVLSVPLGIGQENRTSAELKVQVSFNSGWSERSSSEDKKLVMEMVTSSSDLAKILELRSDSPVVVLRSAIFCNDCEESVMARKLFQSLANQLGVPGWDQTRCGFFIYFINLTKENG